MLVQGRRQATAVPLAVSGFFRDVWLGASFRVLPRREVRQRATVTALLFPCLKVLAPGGVPLCAGFLTDHRERGYFPRTAAAALRAAMPQVSSR